MLLNPRTWEGVPEVLASKIKTIEEDRDYDPTPGSFWGLCGITAHCPTMAQALMPVEIMAPTTREDAEKAASLPLTLQQMKKELATRLREGVRANGPVPVGNMIFGTNQSVSYDLDPRLVTMTLLEAGPSRE